MPNHSKTGTLIITLISMFWHYQVLLRFKKQLTPIELSVDWPKAYAKNIRVEQVLIRMFCISRQ